MKVIGMKIEKIIEEVTEGLTRGHISPDTAKVAIKGGLRELMEEYQAKIKEKDEQLKGMRSAISLADQRVRELEKLVSEKPKKKEQKKPEIHKAEKAAGQNRKMTYKEKICKSCGKSFQPRYGAQTICDTCKDKVYPVSKDIKDTAAELAAMGD